jgi:hypothetical protein
MQQSNSEESEGGGEGLGLHGLFLVEREWGVASTPVPGIANIAFQ